MVKIRQTNKNVPYIPDFVYNGELWPVRAYPLYASSTVFMLEILQQISQENVKILHYTAYKMLIQCFDEMFLGLASEFGKDYRYFSGLGHISVYALIGSVEICCIRV